MDAILLDGRRGRLWFCKKLHGHAMGIVIQVEMDGHMIDQLLLFRETLSMEGADDDKATVVFSVNVNTKGTVEGTMHDIECDHCASKRTWFMDKKQVASLLGPLYSTSSK